MKKKNNYKNTINILNKLTIITIIIVILILIGTPIFIYLNSKYKIINKNSDNNVDIFG